MSNSYKFFLEGMVKRMEINGLFVLLLGLGTVFVGLICLIVIIYIMGAIMRKVTAKRKLPLP